MENLVDPSIALSPSYRQITDELRFEALRLNTFRNWPAEDRIDPTRVAKAGFFYTGKRDEVQCFACRGKIQAWDYGDQAMARHRQMNPSCPFVLNRSSNVPITALGSSSFGNTPVDVQHLDSDYDTRSRALSVPHNSVLRIDSSPSQTSEGYASGEVHSSQSSSLRSSSSSEEGSPIRPSPSSSSSSSSSSSASLSLPFRRPYRSFEEWQALLREEVRYRTFGEWIVPFVHPRDLSRWGFFYTGVGDSVQCNFCQGVISGWVQGDDPETRHRNSFPSCPLVLGLPVGNVTSDERSVLRQGLELFPVNPRLDHVSCDEQKWEQLGITAYRGPQNTHFSTYESRLSSYENWSVDLRQTPEIMAQAGFFYLGVKDHVKCFHCNGGLRNWEKEDDPWTEHARWFSKCGFLRLVRGDQFIKECLEKLPRQVDSKRDEPIFTSTVSDGTLRGMMTSPIVKAVLEMGIDSSRVKQALRRRLSIMPDAFPSVESLLKAALEVQHDDEHRQQLEYDNTDIVEWEASRRPRTAPRYVYEPIETVAVPVEPETSDTAVGVAMDGVIESPPSTDSATSSEHTNAPACTSTPASAEKAVEENVDMRKESVEPVAESRPSGNQEVEKALALEEENRRLKEARLCKVCMDEEVGVVFLPCGHLITCIQCAPSLSDCPLCRQTIRGTVRTFLA